MKKITSHPLSRQFSFLFALFSVFLIVNQAFAESTPTSTVLVSSGESNSITSFTLQGKDNKATLTMLNEYSFPDAESPSLSTPMTITNDKKRVYVVTRNNAPRLYQYALNNQNAELRLESSQAISNSYAYIELSPSNEALLAASYPKHVLSNYALNQKGEAVHQQSIGSFLNAHGIAINKENNTVLMPALGEDKVHQFSILNKANSLLHNTFTDFPKHSGPRHLAFHPSYNALYVLGEFDANVYQLAYSASEGQYTIVEQVAMMNDARSALISNASDDKNKPFKAADIKVSQNGKLVFATERRSNSLCSFQINQGDYSLSLQMCIDTEAWPRGIQIADAHNVVIAAGKESHHIALYQFDEQGNMNFLSRHATGNGPNWIEVIGRR